MHFNMNSYKTGLLAEWRAVWMLRMHGFRIVRRRYVTGRQTARAEIDIIARNKNTLVFIEVKARPTVAAAWDAITPAQIVRLRRAAETYIAKTQWRGNARFDVIIVCGWHIHWCRGAI